METRGPAGTTCLKVWNVSYGPRCLEVAAETLDTAIEIARSHLGQRLSQTVPAGILRVTAVDRTIIVGVQ
jgi:hypothetical protein